jgi:hypothetical protein
MKMDFQSPMALILVGQSELWNRLGLQANAAIRQRIDMQCYLPPMDRAEIGAYMSRHLSVAGAEHELFTEAAVDEIYRFSSGAARLVNKLCTHALIYGATEQAPDCGRPYGEARHSGRIDMILPVFLPGCGQHDRHQQDILHRQPLVIYGLAVTTQKDPQQIAMAKNVLREIFNNK